MKTKSIKIMLALLVTSAMLPTTSLFAAEKAVNGQPTTQGVAKQEGFVIETEKGIDNENDLYTRFKVSFDGKSAQRLEKEGKLMAMRYASDGVNFQAWTPTVAYAIGEGGRGEYSTITLSKKGKIQFAVTTLDFPKTPKFEYDLSLPQYNIGLSEVKDVLYIDNYIAPPMLRTSSPSVQATLLPVKQKINVQLDEAMEVIDPSKPVTIVVETTQHRVEYKLSDINWSNGTATLYDGTIIDVSNISFSFTPDKTYQGSANIYSFYVKNLRGVTSKKEAAAFGYRTSMRDEASCGNTAFKYLFSVVNVNKIADTALNATNFKPTNIYGSTNVVLVAEKAGATASFDLSLNCVDLLSLMNPGLNLRFGVPYPAGFDVRDQAVTYKAYWFVKGADGKYTAKELKTQITSKGLEVVSSSLPF